MGHELAVVVAVLIGIVAQTPALKWVRVGQREHYLPGRIGPFFALWFRASFVNQALLVVGLVLLVGSFVQSFGVTQCTVVNDLQLRTSMRHWGRSLV